MRSVNFFILAIALFFFLSVAQAGQAAGVTVYFFYGQGCPHCAKEEIFLQDLVKLYPDVKVKKFEVWHNQENLNLLKKVGSELSADISGVPFTLVGADYIVGFSSSKTTGQQILKLIENCHKQPCQDFVGPLLSNQDDFKSGEVIKDKPEKSVKTEKKLPEKLSLPLVGDINIKLVSLPVLTVVMGLLDGFNPCAMWVLIFLIGFLIGMEDKKRRWALGGVFLLASAGVYYVFMAAWLNLLLFLGVIIWVRLAIGFLALGGGFVNLREYFKNPTGACKVTRQKERKLVFERLKEIALKRSFWLALGGIIILAFAVNLVELICSAGLPAVYTQVLALSNLSSWQYYAYILLYIFFFLIDDILVFVIAMVTLEVTGLSSKYSRYSSLIGGLIMLIIGVLLIFKPEWLMFG